MKKSVIFLILFTQLSGLAFGYSFYTDPTKWSDAEVESFLFLSQVQKKAKISKESNLCIDVSEPIQGGKQTMRVISKGGDNANGGLFQTGKAEIANVNLNDVESNIGKINAIVGLSTGYQQAIMQYDESTGMPKATDPSIAKSYMSAEVIGYTDGEAVGVNQNASLTAGGSLLYSSNSSLGKYRADYLSTQLGLDKTFSSVTKKSVTSEKALSGSTDEIKECSTWRSAELRMTFQTGTKASSERSWSMATKMAPEKQRLMMQYEASKQMADALAGPLPKSREEAYYVVDPTTAKKKYSPDFASLCQMVIDKISATHYSKACTKQRDCSYSCGTPGVVIQIQPNTSSKNADFHLIKDGKIVGDFKDTIIPDEKMIQTSKAITEQINIKYDEQILKTFPDCKTENLAELKILAKQVELVAGDCSKPSPFTTITASDKCAAAALSETKSVGGKSGRLFKCINMKRVMNTMYSQGECKTGAEFDSVNFPHKNAHLACKFCGSGWNAKEGAVSFRERYDMSTSAISANTTKSTPTFGALQSPGIHEISDCEDCTCTDKSSKVSKVFSVGKVDANNIVGTVNKNSCYCTPPVAPSCFVGPDGATDGPEHHVTTQKHFYNSCTQQFVAIADGKSRNDQLVDLVNQFNKGCDANCATTTNIKDEVAKVNSMMCENQNVQIPTDDPLADCTKEEARTAK